MTQRRHFIERSGESDEIPVSGLRGREGLERADPERTGRAARAGRSVAEAGRSRGGGAGDGDDRARPGRHADHHRWALRGLQGAARGVLHHRSG